MSHLHHRFLNEFTESRALSDAVANATLTAAAPGNKHMSRMDEQTTDKRWTGQRFTGPTTSSFQPR